MALFNQQKDIQTIRTLDTEYKKYLKLSKEMVERLRTELLTRSIIPKYENNILEFNYWGFNFIVRSEIRISANGSFNLGELKAYLLNKSTEMHEPLLTYTFDQKGKINNNYNINDFSKFYYYELIVNLIEYSINKDKMFQLL
jgi:hypothetical protein